MAGVRALLVLTVVAAMSWAMVGSSGSDTPSIDSKVDPARQAELERVFQEALSGSTMVGSWRMTPKGGLAANAPLGASRDEKYTITKVEKVLDDNWLVHARIEFAEQDATIPVPVRVIWSGDTPVITVEQFQFPGMGPYSARVMVYRNFYAGTWFGPDYGGVLSGQIVKEAPPAGKPGEAAGGEAPAPGGE